MVISLIVLVLLSYVYTATKSLLKYSNFKLLNYDKYLITDYGVTLKKNISIEKNSISAIMIKSSLLQNLLNFEEVKVISMNPENEKKDKEIILPIIKKETSKKHLEKILNYNIKFLPFYKNETKIILLKLIRKTIVLLLFLSIDYFINNLYLSILIYMLCIYILLKQVISVFLTTYSFSNNFIVIKKQDFNRDILIIPTEKIEEIIIKQSFFQRAFNVGSIVIVNKAVPPSKFKILDININQLINFKNQLIKH
ncbi:PH domain-containing protein [Staphylococcus caprae]